MTWPEKRGGRAATSSEGGARGAGGCPGTLGPGRGTRRPGPHRKGTERPEFVGHGCHSSTPALGLAPADRCGTHARSGTQTHTQREPRASHRPPPSAHQAPFQRTRAGGHSASPPHTLRTRASPARSDTQIPRTHHDTPPRRRAACQPADTPYSPAGSLGPLEQRPVSSCLAHPAPTPRGVHCPLCASQRHILLYPLAVLPSHWRGPCQRGCGPLRSAPRRREVEKRRKN